MSRVIQTRRARETGATIRVLDNRGSDWTLDPENWYTECLTHGDMCGHDTRAQATGWAVQPAMWCDGCREIFNQKRAANTR
mgnify:CR=1 FL=1